MGIVEQQGQQRTRTRTKSRDDDGDGYCRYIINRWLNKQTNICGVFLPILSFSVFLFFVVLSQPRRPRTQYRQTDR